MANLFYANEIVKMNITEEQNGAAYYSALAEKAKSKKLREAAARIAEQERHHEKLFTELLERLGEPEVMESYPGEYDAYVKALLDYKIFPDAEAAAAMAREKSDADAVRLAIQTERNTLLLLEELRKHVPDAQRQYVDVTIREEQQHLADLNAILAQL
jgi:rubrerythrin